VDRKHPDRRPAVVPYLDEATIERRAMQLLAGYQRRFETALAPPIPVDEIVELHLGLRLEITDLQDELRIPGTLGATWVAERRVAIDASLDPESHPALEGRYRFTLAHEVGHWQLHRHIAPLARFNQASLLPERDLLRRTLSRLEHQANLFAAALLMPRVLVRQAWRETRGGNQPFCVAALGPEFAWLREYLSRAVQAGGSQCAAEDLALRAGQPTVGDAVSSVSPEAMRIRLEGLGLLMRTPTVCKPSSLLPGLFSDLINTCKLPRG
jgi:hypothetical protein